MTYLTWAVGEGDPVRSTRDALVCSEIVGKDTCAPQQRKNSPNLSYSTLLHNYETLVCIQRTF